MFMFLILFLQSRMLAKEGKIDAARKTSLCALIFIIIALVIYIVSLILVTIAAFTIGIIVSGEMNKEERIYH